jgi:hypothetical protein
MGTQRVGSLRIHVCGYFHKDALSAADYSAANCCRNYAVPKRRTMRCRWPRTELTKTLGRFATYHSYMLSMYPTFASVIMDAYDSVTVLQMISAGRRGL